MKIRYFPIFNYYIIKIVKSHYIFYFFYKNFIELFFTVSARYKCKLLGADHSYCYYVILKPDNKKWKK